MKRRNFIESAFGAGMIGTFSASCGGERLPDIPFPAEKVANKNRFATHYRKNDS